MWHHSDSVLGGDINDGICTGACGGIIICGGIAMEVAVETAKMKEEDGAETMAILMIVVSTYRSNDSYSAGLLLMYRRTIPTVLFLL